MSDTTPASSSSSTTGSSRVKRGLAEMLKGGVIMDVVDVERLEDLGFDEVSDASLRHDGDGHLGDDRFDEVRIAHASHAAL